MAREDQYRDRSVLIHGKFKSEKWDFRYHITPPITTAVAFRLGSAARGAQGFSQFANPDVDRGTAPPIYIYDRMDEPCSGLLEETLAFAEKGECAVCYGTGMAAISAAIGVHVKSGEHLCYHPAIYGATYSYIVKWLDRFGVSSTAVSFEDMQALGDAVKPETRVLFFETPCNPTMELIDLAAVAEFAEKINADRPPESRLVTIIDNTFASPSGQRPLPFGIDFSIHSLTKHISGFGATMGGVVVGPRSKETDLLQCRSLLGGSISPDAAWHILTYGVPSLAMRLEKQQEIAQVVAEALESHPKVAKVFYPGLDSFEQKDLARRQMLDFDGNFAPGSMIYFVLAGDYEQSYKSAVIVSDYIADNALSVTLAVSLGQIRTLMEHPASMTHSSIPPEEQVSAGILPGGIRLSVGIEDVNDIVRDLTEALDSLD
ncbi:MAG: PLP-dependent transferase [Armatimonadetes bacterium]|nr:PLP-dependent transferase [Armatimonadota bacterium]